MFNTKPEDMAMEIGQRCRRVRMAKGLSQQALADLAETSPQNISKFEKSGISDIYWIKKLSMILDTNLEDNEADQEGVVGEVGKEILYTLIIRGGHEETKDILNSEMYGLNAERVAHEIFKLERLGMVVREQYTGWEDLEEDVTFITAKGLITTKNMQLNHKMEEEVFNTIEDVETYEYIIGDSKSYQEFIDERPAEKMIREIFYAPSYVAEIYTGVLNTDYRCNYVKWLKENFENGFEKDIIYEGEFEQWIPSRSIYFDIMYRMAFGIEDEMYWLETGDDGSYIIELRDLVDDAEHFLDINQWDDRDWIKERTERVFQSVLEYKPVHVNTDNNKEKLFNLSEEIEDFENMKDLLEDNDISELDNANIKGKLLFANMSPSELYAEKAKIRGNISPLDWFSVDEIRDFIERCFRPAETDEEKQLDATLKEINRLIPETLDYYTFPREWEENGLADLVRSNYGLAVPKDDEEKEE